MFGDRCGRPVHARGWCGKHYQRWRGKPHDPWISLHARLIALVEAADTDECILWSRTLSDTGYGSLRVDGVTVIAHSVACEVAHGPRPSGAEVAHGRSDGTPCVSRACVNPRHLRWTTRQENALDRRLHGSVARKFTVDQVREMRRRRLAGETIRHIACSFGAYPCTVRSIVNRRTWAWLTDDAGIEPPRPD